MKRVIEPFRGWRFDDEKVDLSRVIVPPEGVLKVVDPRNARELTDPEVEGEDPSFARRAQRQRLFLGAWRAAGVIDREEDPAVYFLRGEREEGRVVSGFFALVRAENVRALVAPEAARVEWERSRARAFDVEPELVVLAHDDEGDEITRLFRGELDREGDARFDDLGVAWELWVVDDETTIARVQARMAERQLTVLAGTERVEAAKHDDALVLALISSSSDVGLAPVHLEVHSDKEGAELGVLSALQKHFETRELDAERRADAALFQIKDRGTYEVLPSAGSERPLAIELASVLDAANVSVRRVPAGAPRGDGWSCFVQLPSVELADLVAHRGRGTPLPRGLFTLEPDVPRGLVLAEKPNAS